MRDDDDHPQGPLPQHVRSAKQASANQRIYVRHNRTSGAMQSVGITARGKCDSHFAGYFAKNLSRALSVLYVPMHQNMLGRPPLMSMCPKFATHVRATSDGWLIVNCTHLWSVRPDLQPTRVQGICSSCKSTVRFLRCKTFNV